MSDDNIRYCPNCGGVLLRLEPDDDDPQEWECQECGYSEDDDGFSAIEDADPFDSLRNSYDCGRDPFSV